MVAQVVLDEGLDEVVAVVVARPQAQLEGLPGGLAGLGQDLGFELLGEELVGAALVDQERGLGGLRLDQFAGVVPALGLPVLAQIVAERLPAPGTLHGRGDRRESRDRAIGLRRPEVERQRPVAAHRVAEDALAR